jgi:hypothetical protein
MSENAAVEEPVLRQTRNPFRGWFAADSPLEESGFELVVPL